MKRTIFINNAYLGSIFNPLYHRDSTLVTIVNHLLIPRISEPITNNMCKDHTLQLINLLIEDPHYYKSLSITRGKPSSSFIPRNPNYRS